MQSFEFGELATEQSSEIASMKSAESSELKLVVPKPDSNALHRSNLQGRQIGLVRRECNENGIVNIRTIAEAYHRVKEEQIGDKVWCYDNFTTSGSNSSGIIKSGAHSLGEDCIIWPINHYLALNRHPKVIEASVSALREFGTGCGTSAMSGGHCRLHKDLEERLAQWLGKESALLFPTGYSANLGAISGLLKGPSSFVIFDRECHASIIDGIKLSGAPYLSFRHNDIDDLSRKLKRYANKYDNVLVVVESIYSMSGEIAKLQDIVALKDRHNFFLYVDEAHSFGILPERTLVNKLKIADQVDFVMTTLSKSTGSIGGVVASARYFTTLLQVEANSYLFQAAMPPADVAAVIAAMDVIEDCPGIISSLWAKSDYMRSQLQQNGFDIGGGQSPIIPLYVRNSELLMELGRELYENGIFTTSVAYPVVKHSEVRFRFIVNESHSYAQIDQTIEILKSLFSKMGLIGGLKDAEI